MKKNITASFISILFLFNTSFALAQTSTSTPDTAVLIKQLQELVTSLQKQVLDLRAQLKTTRGELETVKTDVKELKLTRSLQRGTIGDDVKQLQEFLSIQYPNFYPTKQITGYFGPATETAIKKLQEQHGIESVGIVGPKTLAKLNELITEGAGESGNIPSGLLHAPGIQQKLGLGDGISPAQTPSGTIPAIPAQPRGQTGTTTIPAIPAIPATTTIIVPPPAPGVVPPPGTTPPPVVTTPPPSTGTSTTSTTTPPPSPTPSPTTPPTTATSNTMIAQEIAADSFNCVLNTCNVAQQIVPQNTFLATRLGFKFGGTGSGTVTLTLRSSLDGTIIATTRSLPILIDGSFTEGDLNTSALLTQGNTYYLQVNAIIPGTIRFYFAYGNPYSGGIAYAQAYSSTSSGWNCNICSNNPINGDYTFRIYGSPQVVSPPQTPPPTTATTSVVYDFSLSNDGSKSVVQGSSVSASISSSITAGNYDSSYLTTFTTANTSGLSMYFSPASCVVPCVSTLNIATSATTTPGTYSIVVTATRGNVSRTTTVTVTVTTSATSSIPQVQGLTATVSGTSVILSWQAVAGYNNAGFSLVYNLYLGTTPDFVPNAAYNFAATDKLSFTDLNRPAGTYYYKVAVKNIYGDVGPMSQAVSAVVAAPLPPPPPSPPSSLSAPTSISSQLAINPYGVDVWDKTKEWVSFNYTFTSNTNAFRLYEKRPGANSFSLIAELNNLSGVTCGVWSTVGSWNITAAACDKSRWGIIRATDISTSLFPEGTYEYYVTAVDTAGVEGAPSLASKLHVLSSPTILSPIGSSPSTPIFRWVAQNGWPSNISYGPYNIYVAEVGIQRYFWSQYSLSADSANGYQYAGPALDPAKTYIAHIIGYWYGQENWYSLDQAPKIFTVSAATTTSINLNTTSELAQILESLNKILNYLKSLQ